jgi:mono/diheme cytochrome c family protein
MGRGQHVAVRRHRARRRLRELLGRIGIVAGLYPSSVAEARAARAVPWPALGDSLALGRYVAQTACAECHGGTLAGGRGPVAGPDLAITLGYDRAAFTRLMRTGRGIGDRDLGLMSSVARDRFALLTDAEVDALHEYLTARAHGRD